MFGDTKRNTISSNIYGLDTLQFEPVQDSDGGVKLEMTSLYSTGPGGDYGEVSIFQPLGVIFPA